MKIVTILDIPLGDPLIFFCARYSVIVVKQIAKYRTFYSLYRTFDVIQLILAVEDNRSGRCNYLGFVISTVFLATMCFAWIENAVAMPARLSNNNNIMEDDVRWLK